MSRAEEPRTLKLGGKPRNETMLMGASSKKVVVPLGTVSDGASDQGVIPKYVDYVVTLCTPVQRRKRGNAQASTLQSLSLNATACSHGHASGAAMGLRCA